MIRQYLRSHRFGSIALGFTILSLALSKIASDTIGMPATTIVMQFGDLVPMVYALLVVGSCHGTMENFEQIAGSAYQATRVSVAAAIYTCSLLMFTLFSQSERISAGVIVFARSEAIWVGLGVLCGQVFGWRFFWAIPLLAIFPLSYLNPLFGDGPAWWNWPFRPAQDPGPWVVLVVVTFLAGACASRRVNAAMRRMRIACVAHVRLRPSESNSIAEVTTKKGSRVHRF